MAKQDKEVRVETFRQYLARRLRGVKKAPQGIEGWDTQMRGENAPKLRNEMKRTERAIAKVNRLAHIRYMRVEMCDESHVPKLKRVPQYVFA